MRIGIGIDELFGPITLDAWVERVRDAAERGFAAAWSAQGMNWDALTALAVVGRAVPGIALGTAIVPTYPRHPLMLASQALTVQAAIGNRLSLGVGPGVQFDIEERFGYSFDRPAGHMREYLTALAPLLRGESVAYRGETLKAVGTVAVPEAEPPSLLISALGPAMLRLAGELTDGAIPILTGPAAIADYVLPTITRAAAPGRPAPRVVVGVLASVTADADRARSVVAEQFGSIKQVPAYRAMLDRQGVAGLEELVIAGDGSAVERELRRYADAGATELMAYPVGPEDDRARTIEVLADLARAGSGGDTRERPGERVGHG
jgi:F420-dependent oxidoreductase-like protein